MQNGSGLVTRDSAMLFVQLVVALGKRKGQTIPIAAEKFIIGRAEDCHLKSQSELISRYHCAILVGDEVCVRDLGSKNGVRLNGEKIVTERKLNNGDKLTIGPLEFYLNIVADALISPPLAASVNDFSGIGESGCRLGIDSTEATVLLDQLMTLNQEKEVESKSLESSPLKRIL